jgi:hypothetical protein
MGTAASSDGPGGGDTAKTAGVSCANASLLLFRLSPAWWLLRSDKTRSHPELGRQTLLHRWYYVLRPGRVGRCQACEGRKTSLPDDFVATAGFPCEACRLPIWRRFGHRAACRGVEQPGSSSGS